MKISRLITTSIAGIVVIIIFIILLLSICLDVHGQDVSINKDEYILVAGAEKVINVINNDESIIYEIKKEKYSEEEKIMLQKIALAEAEVDGIGAMAKVMQVVEERIKSNDFPNSVEGVIFQSGQFTTITNGRYDQMIPNENSKKALELLEVLEPIDALYFEAVTDKETWHSRNLEFCFNYKGHNFYK